METMTRNFGVELEIVNLTASRAVQVLTAAGIDAYDAGYTHQVSNQWKVVSDSSVFMEVNGVKVYGCEVVSPKLCGQHGRDQVRRVCKALEAAGAKVNKTCGFHVHVNAADLDLGQIKRVVKTWVKYEDTVDTLIAPSRRNNYFARSNAATLTGYYTHDYRSGYHASRYVAEATVCEQAFAVIDKCKSVDDLRLAHGEERYHKLNLEAYYRHRTIEFRGHQGTVDADKALAWVEFCLKMVCVPVATAAVVKRNERKDGNKGADRLPAMFKALALTADERKYFTARAKKLAVAA
jgi:hypothetical protein